MKIKIVADSSANMLTLDGVDFESAPLKISTAERDFIDDSKPISIAFEVEFTEDDLQLFHQKGMVSKYKRYELWLNEFKEKLPSFALGTLKFECIINREGHVKYTDGYKNNNVGDKLEYDSEVIIIVSKGKENA